MKTILELETEVGKCAWDELYPLPPRDCLDSLLCAVLVRTHASVQCRGRSVVLRLEHRCVIRCGQRITSQRWINAKSSCEAVPASESAMVELATDAHEAFVSEAKATASGLSLNVAH